MTKTNRIRKTSIAAAAAVAALAVGTTAYAAGVAGALHYGRTTVRGGVPLEAARFQVSSPDLADGSFPAADYAAVLGCTGQNREPVLDWSGAPSGTKSFAITMFDPDAPTGSGFWHQLTWDVPGTATSFDGNAALPAGTVAGTNDGGLLGYFGPCPNVGDITHHYKIRVLALDVPSLGLDAHTPAAVTTVVLGPHVIGVAELTATARR